MWPETLTRLLAYGILTAHLYTELTDKAVSTDESRKRQRGTEV